VDVPLVWVDTAQVRVGPMRLLQLLLDDSFSVSFFWWVLGLSGVVSQYWDDDNTQQEREW
jgi:hypothetical protein